MAIKQQSEILKELKDDFIAEQDGVTSLGKEASIRAFLNAVAHVQFEMWNDIYQTKRGLHATTAAGADLVLLASRWGLEKLGASKSSVVVLINGPVNTVIPAETIIVSSVNSSLQYKIVNAVSLGTANPDIQRPVNAESIGDIVIAESLTEGSSTKVNAKELTQFLVPITGVTVTNLSPSVGGADAESDEDFRTRLLGQIDLLAQGTQAFYEACVKNIKPEIIKAYATKEGTANTLIYMVQNDYTLFPATELLEIEESVKEVQRAFTNVRCLNASVLSIEIRIYVYIKSGYTSEQIFSSMAPKIADYVQTKFGFGAVIKYQELIYEILGAEGIAGIDLNQFTLNGKNEDARCASNQVPRFTFLAVSDAQNTISRNINQRYLVI